MIRSPLIARIKRTSVAVSTEERLSEDLETMKNLVAALEKETHTLTNYKPLAARIADKETDGDVKMETSENTIPEPDLQHVHRGSAAVEKLLEKRLPPADAEGASLIRVCLSPHIINDKFVFTFVLENLLSFHPLFLSSPSPLICTWHICVPPFIAATTAP